MPNTVIHVFLGTKAQLIKMAPVMRELQDRNIEYNFVFSGQHQETIEDIRLNFGIKEPDCTLHTNSDVNSIPKMFTWMFKVIIKTVFNHRKIWKGDKQGIVLNHGDTFSTLLGSILAKMSGHKNAHIESGLRSFNFLHPFPEEITRLLVFRLTDVFFAPGEWALGNLSKFKGIKIDTKVNTLTDSLRRFESMGSHHPGDIPQEEFAIASIHRFENLSSKNTLTIVVNTIEEIAKDIKVLFILHSPTLRKLRKYGLLKRLETNRNIELRQRYDYFRFINLVKKSEYVVTDGGSNQEECSYLGKPCLILRNATERQEGIGENAILSQFDNERITQFTANYKDYRKKPGQSAASPSAIIVNQISEYSNIEN